MTQYIFRTLLSLFAMLFFTNVAFSQKMQQYACSYNGNNVGILNCNVSASPQALDIESKINKIVQAVGLKRNFTIIECSNVKNAIAFNLEVGNKIERVIVYDPNFIDKFKKVAKTDWAATSILAHEIGHHLNGHTLNFKRDDSYLNELEADEFSGFVLKMMGATLEEAKSALNSLPNPNGSFTHPPQKDRLGAVSNGWKRAGVQSSLENNVSEANKWFIKGVEEKSDLKSIEYFTKSIQLNPQLHEAYCNRGIVKMRLEIYEDAIKDFNDAINIKPAPFYFYLRAKTRNNLLQNVESVIADISVAIREESQNIRYYAFRASVYETDTNSYSNAIEDYNKIIQLNSKNIDAYFRKITLYKKMGRLNEVFNEFKILQGFDPENYNILIEIADFCFEKFVVGDPLYWYDNSTKEFEKSRGEIFYTMALKLKGSVGEKVLNGVNYLENSFDSGYIFMKMEKYSEAIKAFTKALDINKTGTTYFMRGVCFYRQGNWDNAISDFSTGLKLDINENGVEAEEYLKQKYLTLIAYAKSFTQDKKQLEEAIAYFTSYWKTDIAYFKLFYTGFTEDDAVFYPFFLKGFCLQNLNKYSDAIELYKEAIQIYPDRPFFYKSIAKVYSKMKKFQLADEIWTTVVSLQSDSLLSVDEFNQYAWNCILNKQPQKAIILLNKGLKIDPNNLVMQGNIAHAYLLDGQFEKAKNIYWKFKDENLNFNMSWRNMIKQDFSEFKDVGIKSQYFDTILDLLSIK